MGLFKIMRFRLIVDKCNSDSGDAAGPSESCDLSAQRCSTDIGQGFPDELVGWAIPELVVVEVLISSHLIVATAAAHENEPRLAVPSCHGRR